MSYMKRFAEEVMVDMGKDEIDDEVLAEAQRRIDPAEYPHERLEQFWVSYDVGNNGAVNFMRDYRGSMKCKWTAFIHDLEKAPGKWRIVVDSDERKAVAYDDQFVRMTVFQLVTVKALVQEPEGSSEYVSIGQCIKDGTHLTDCDDDGYCNYCGEQDG